MRRSQIVLRIAIACVTLWCSATALGQHATSDPIDGKWTVTFTVQGQSVSGEMTFQAHGQKLAGTVDTTHTGHGQLTGGAFSQNKLSGIYVFDGHQAIAIAGELADGKLAGAFRTEGMNGKWEAVRASAQ